MRNLLNYFLRKASSQGWIIPASFLIRMGADPYSEDSEGYNSIWNSVINKNKNVISLFISMKCNFNLKSETIGDALFNVAVSIYGDDPEYIKTLINSGININQTNYEGFTPIMTASLYGYVETVKLLIEYGADVNAKSKSGDAYAIKLAYIEGEGTIIKLLSDAGAKIEDKDIEFFNKLKQFIKNE